MALRDSARGMAGAISAAFLIALAVTMTQVSASARWPIRTLIIDASFSRVTAEQLRAAIEPEIEQGFFMLRLDAIRERIEEEPWVRRAQLQKFWPDQLAVTVLEHEPLARLDGGGLLSSEGEVFDAGRSDDEIRGLPLFRVAPGEEAEALRVYAQLSRLLEQAPAEIVALELSARRSVRLTLDTGLRVALGSEAHAERLTRFLRAWPALDLTNVASVDLRYPNGLALRRIPAELAGS